MNFDSERNKPLFVVRKIDIIQCYASNELNEAILNRSAVPTNFSNSEYLIKASAAEKLPAKVQVAVDESTSEELKELVVKRYETDESEKFQFLDGRVFLGKEAAIEVKKNSEIGKYFFDLDVETLRVAQKLFRDKRL